MTFTPTLIFGCWDTECYATEIEQSALGAMTKPIDQVGAFITAVVLFGNVIPRL